MCIKLANDSDELLMDREMLELQLEFSITSLFGKMGLA
jgi:hypothetical protein